MPRYCAIRDCFHNTESDPEKGFHLFPLDPERCLQWMKNCDRLDLKDKGIKSIHTNYRVCGVHFPNNMYAGMSRTRLKKNAVPVLFLPETVKLPEVKHDLENGTLTSKKEQVVVKHVAQPNPVSISDPKKHLDNKMHEIDDPRAKPPRNTQSDLSRVEMPLPRPLPSKGINFIGPQNLFPTLISTSQPPICNQVVIVLPNTDIQSHPSSSSKAMQLSDIQPSKFYAGVNNIIGATEYSFSRESTMDPPTQRLKTLEKVEQFFEPKSEPLDEENFSTVLTEFNKNIEIKENDLNIKTENLNDFDRESSNQDKTCLEFSSEGYITSVNNNKIKQEILDDIKTEEKESETYKRFLTKIEPSDVSEPQLDGKYLSEFKCNTDDTDVFDGDIGKERDYPEIKKYPSINFSENFKNKEYQNNVCDEKALTITDTVLLNDIVDTNNKNYYDNIADATRVLSKPNDLLQCSLCSFRAERKSYLDSHIKNHMEPEDVDLFQCSHCSYLSKRKFNLMEHMLIHMKDVETFQCDQCSYKTTHKSHIRNHIKIHKKPNYMDMFHCCHCSYSTKLRGDICQHIKTHMETNQTDVFECFHCSYKTMYESNFKYHLKIHMNLKESFSYQCKECFFKCKLEVSLKLHMRSHKKQGRAECLNKQSSVT